MAMHGRSGWLPLLISDIVSIVFSAAARLRWQSKVQMREVLLTPRVSLSSLLSQACFGMRVVFSDRSVKRTIVELLCYLYID